MSTPTTNLGLLGCGHIAQVAHMPALERAEGVRFTALCDAAQDLAEHFAERYAVQAFTDLDEFLDRADIEVVIIAVGHAFHVPLATKCLQAGKHVLVEKPMGVTLEECEQLCSVVEESGRLLQVGYMKRHDEGIQCARRLQQERLGETTNIHHSYRAGGDYQQHLHMFTPHRRGSAARLAAPDVPHRGLVRQLFEQIHALDTLRNFGGDVVRVAAVDSSVGGGPTCGSVALQFASGATGTLQYAACAREWQEYTSVVGNGGELRVYTAHPYLSQASRVEFIGTDGVIESPICRDGDAYERQVEDFARAVREGLRPAPDHIEAAADQALLEAIAKALETGSWIDIAPAS